MCKSGTVHCQLILPLSPLSRCHILLLLDLVKTLPKPAFNVFKFHERMCVCVCLSTIVRAKQEGKGKSQMCVYVFCCNGSLRKSTEKTHTQTEKKLFLIDKSFKRFPFMHYPNYILLKFCIRFAVSFQFHLCVSFEFVSCGCASVCACFSVCIVFVAVVVVLPFSFTIRCVWFVFGFGLTSAYVNQFSLFLLPSLPSVCFTFCLICFFFLSTFQFSVVCL